MATLRASNVTPTDTAYANDLLASALRTLATVNARSEDRLFYIRRFNCKTTLSGEERVAERLVYNRFFDTAVAERGTNGVDGLLAALDDKQLEVSLLQAAKAQATTHFKGGSGGPGGSGGGGGGGGTKPTKTDTWKTDKTQPPRPKEPTKPQPDRPGKQRTAATDEQGDEV
eukprot:jgi/Tetstr1/464872/TSEL_009609.t1